MPSVSPPTRPLLRWHGGKWKLAPWVIQHFPRHDIYVEPYGGAASVLLRKNRVKTEVWNDLSDDLVSLFGVLRDDTMSDALVRACALTPFARAEFDISYTPTDDPVERARRFIVRSFMGYGSKACVSLAKNGFRSLRTGETSHAVEWCNYPDALRIIVCRMRGVVLEHLPALEVIRRYDRPEALFYLDPPYVYGSRNLNQGTYHHEMTDADHRELAERLRIIKGMALVSGYSSPLYDELYAGWRRVERRHYADKSSPRTECLWLSPKADAALHNGHALLEACRG